jgi:hypothetical protein
MTELGHNTILDLGSQFPDPSFIMIFIDFFTVQQSHSDYYIMGTTYGLPSVCVFKFVHNTLFETFWKTIGAVERDIRGPQMKSDVALSEKEDFPKMQDIAMTSWTQCNNYVRIQKTVEKDFEG